MEDLPSNAEVRSETSKWVSEIRQLLDRDRSRKLAVLGSFRDPWTHAVAIGALKSAGLRYREIAPNPSPRLRCLQVAHQHNLLDWPSPGFVVIRARPDNLFDPPSRAQMLEKLGTATIFSPQGEKMVAVPSFSIGDVLKIEGGWALAIAADRIEIPNTIRGLTLRPLGPDEIASLPPATQTGPKSAVVASPRIDAVASGVLKPSREQIKKHLDSGGVLLNYQPATKSGKELAPGDIVAVRLAGRFLLDEITGETKKGRVQIKVTVLNGP